jgi:hypothetical protein
VSVKATSPNRGGDCGGFKMKCERCNEREAGAGHNFCEPCFQSLVSKLGKAEESRVNRIKSEKFNKRRSFK